MSAALKLLEKIKDEVLEFGKVDFAITVHVMVGEQPPRHVLILPSLRNLPEFLKIDKPILVFIQQVECIFHGLSVQGESHVYEGQHELLVTYSTVLIKVSALKDVNYGLSRLHTKQLLLDLNKQDPFVLIRIQLSERLFDFLDLFEILGFCYFEGDCGCALTTFLVTVLTQFIDIIFGFTKPGSCS